MHKQRNKTARAALASALLAGSMLATVGHADAAQNVVSVGPGDSINAAIAKAKAGTVIEVQPGTYYEPVKITKDNVTLKSAVPGGAHIVGGSNPAISAYGQDGITVQGFRLSSDTDGVKIGGSPSADANNITFAGNTLEGAGGDGFKFFQTKNLKLLNNTIKQAGLNKNGNGDGGIDLVGVDDSIVQGNEIKSTYGHACLMLKGGSDGNKITGNKLNGCEKDGITVGGFTSSKFMDASDGGVEAHGNEIVGNEVSAGSEKCPFYFNEAQNNKIENNKTTGGKNGCSAVNGTNNANANVDTSTAGSGDKQGDLYEQGGESDGLDPEIQSAMANIGDLACSKGQTMGVIGTAANAVAGFFSGGRATFAGQMMQQGQHVLSNACLAEQAAMQAKIIAKGKYDTKGDIRSGMRRVNKMVENVEEIRWEDMYPETYGEIDQQSQIIWRNVEVKRQYDAGMTSKKTAGEAIAALNELPDRTTGLITATQNAEGPTAVGQAHVQATMMGVEVQSMALSNQIAHQQVVEAHLDKQTAAERRAIEYRARQRRGLPGYEGDGGLGLLMAEDK